MFVVPMTRRSSALVHPFNRLLEDRLERAYSAACAGSGTRTPALDIIDTDTSFIAALDMPGVAKEEVKVTVVGRRVSVIAESSKSESAEGVGSLIHCERAAISYARSFTLPADVEQAETQARLEQGVLTLTLPKRVARNEAHITVN
jgi:HSP20 family protein